VNEPFKANMVGQNFSNLSTLPGILWSDSLHLHQGTWSGTSAGTLFWRLCPDSTKCIVFIRPKHY